MSFKSCLIYFFLIFLFGCTNPLDSSTELSSELSSELLNEQQSTPSPQGQGGLVSEPQIVDIDYNEVYVTQKTALPVNTRSVRLTEMREESSQNYFLEDRIVFSEKEEIEEAHSNITLLFNTSCINGQTEERVTYSGSFAYKNQINLIELIPEKLFLVQKNDSRHHSCDFKFEAQNTEGSTHFFDLPHLPVHSFDEVVNLSLHDKNTDFSKAMTLNKKLIVYFDHMKDYGYYLDVWYDDIIDEVRLVCDDIDYSFKITNQTRHQLSLIPGWDQIPESQRKDQNCRFLSLKSGSIIGLSQSFYLIFNDKDIQTTVIKNFNNDSYNQEILPELDRSLKESWGFEELTIPDFITLRIENKGDQEKNIYIPSIFDIEKNYYFFWVTFFDRFYKNRKSYLQISYQSSRLLKNDHTGTEKGFLISLKKDETREVHFDLMLLDREEQDEDQNFCSKTPLVNVNQWLRNRRTEGISLNREERIRKAVENYNFFDNPLGLGVASFIKLKKPRVYEVSTPSNLELAQEQSMTFDELEKNEENVIFQYSLDYKKYPEFENFVGDFERGQKIMSLHAGVSSILYSNKDRKIGESYSEAKDKLYSENFSNYGIASVLYGSIPNGFLKFNEFNCRYIEMERVFFNKMSGLSAQRPYIKFGLSPYSSKPPESNIFNEAIKEQFEKLVYYGLSSKDLIDYMVLFGRHITHALDLRNFQRSMLTYMRNNNLEEVPFISLNYESYANYQTEDYRIPLFIPKEDQMDPNEEV